MRTVAFAGALALMLGACASDPLNSPGTNLSDEHEAKLKAAVPCCTTYSQMRYASLAKGTETQFELVPTSPVFVFPHGRSFFYAVELPPGTRSLVVKTFPVNTLLNRYP